jgi:hypothetical protein
MADPIVMVKGTPLMSIVSFMNKHLSPEAVERVLVAAAAGFPQEVAKVQGGLILASERFPVAFLNRLIEKIAEELNEPATELSHRLGRIGAESAAGGILKLALSFISMPNLLRKLEPVWQQLYTHGRTTNVSGDRDATVELHDLPYVSPIQCARVTGMFEWFAQRAESSAVVRHSACRARRDAVCRWEINW